MSTKPRHQPPPSQPSIHDTPAVQVVGVSADERAPRRVLSPRHAIDVLRLASSREERSASTSQSDRTPQPPDALKHAEICRQAVLDLYAPACVMVDERSQCVYSIGQIDRYLSIPVGAPTWNIVALARADMRPRLRSALHQVRLSRKPVQLQSNTGPFVPGETRFRVTVSPLACMDEIYVLVSFFDEPDCGVRQIVAPERADVLWRSVGLKALDTKPEPHTASHDLDRTNIEHNADNGNYTANEADRQPTHEKSSISKEELQSLNENLRTVNSQLQKALEHQRVMSNDLRNVLNSTNVATLFLDKKLNIRFFTPAATELFRLIATDMGRPLSDMRALVDDSHLLIDAAAVLHTRSTIEREVSSSTGAWYRRRIFPYLTAEKTTEGVVITFDNVTAQHDAALAIDQSKIAAEQANLDKTRFLGAASHDLRQPLQTLSLVQDMLAKSVAGDARGERLVGRMGETLGAMAGMLNTLLDINQIEAGAVQTNLTAFPIQPILTRLSNEFSYHAQAKQLEIRLVPSRLNVTSDARLLEQILRNIVSNALKYTDKGKVLIGCRRRGDHMRLEVWDTGIGISPQHLERIFKEYEQRGDSARDGGKGFGLGLSIVHRLAELLDHPISVKSVRHMGTVFSVELPLARREIRSDQVTYNAEAPRETEPNRVNSILLIEDDPTTRDMMREFLEGEGHYVKCASNGPDAISEMSHGAFRPDLILADNNLPDGLSGLEASERIRETMPFNVPVIILTGDTSNAVANRIRDAGFLKLSKPVDAAHLKAIVAELGAPVQAPPPPSAAPNDMTGSPTPLIYLVDDDAVLRAGLREILEDDGRKVMDFAACEDFLREFRPSTECCLLLDASLPGMSGLDLLGQLRLKGFSLPVIMVAGGHDVHLAVEAMKAGAMDFIDKPVRRNDLLAAIDRALGQSRGAADVQHGHIEAASHIAALTTRQREIMDMVLAGHPSKNIAADLGISQRTVENHRAAIMRRTGAHSIPALVRLAVLAANPANGATPD